MLFADNVLLSISTVILAIYDSFLQKFIHINSNCLFYPGLYLF